MIIIEREPENFGTKSFEDCAFCHLPTPFWFDGKIAVCPGCAKTHDSADLPSKEEWMGLEKTEKN